MKVEEIRTSFTIYVIATQMQKIDGVCESLALSGYMVARFTELTAAFSEIFSNPPHMLIFDAEEAGFDLQKAIPQVTAQLPESHIFLVVPEAKRAKYTELLDRGVYDLILNPLVTPTALLRSLDRAAERDYLMYLNEGLMERQNAQPEEPEEQDTVSDVSSDEITVNTQVEANPEMESFHQQYARDIFLGNSAEESIRVFMRSASQALGGAGVVYFKYVANRRVLMSALAEKVDAESLQGLGINLNDAVPGFRSVMLREPMRLGPVNEMIREVFAVEKFFSWPIEALGELQGIMIFLSPFPEPSTGEILTGWRVLLEKSISLREAEKRLHVASLKDLQTDVYNRPTFLSKTNEEISRSRRTRLPVALISIAVDQYGQIASNFGAEEAALVLRTAARIIEKHSRVNDALGRTGVDEFGLLLPHTDRRGAMVKAERLRRLIESADFSKVLNRLPRLTISLGISEYPSLVRDAEELQANADEALFQVRDKGNKTCVAKSAPGFQPDFVAEPVKGMQG